MRNHTQQPTTSDPIGVHAQERAPAKGPPFGPTPEACAPPTTTCEGATSASALSTAANLGALLAGVPNHTQLPTACAPSYVDEQELSHLTTLSRTTLQTMRSKGGGPPFAKLGHRIVYRLADVERWIQERTR